MFCSDACEHEFRIRWSPSYARQAVYRRDRGVCTHCRLDCGLLDRIVARLRRGGRDPQPTRDELTGDRIEVPVDEEGERSARWLIEELGFGRRKRPCSLWQADHRIAFSEGGSDCGLGNLRTLCLACHLTQTRELHRRGKTRRRE
jgi:5-methylcytosine-specific restriction endonuclease McrA